MMADRIPVAKAMINRTFAKQKPFYGLVCYESMLNVPFLSPLSVIPEHVYILAGENCDC